jgi:hypothetical protein
MRRMWVVMLKGRLMLPRRTFLDQIGEVLEKGRVKSTQNQRAFMKNLVTVEEAKSVCKDRSKWKEVICVYPKGVILCML